MRLFKTLIALILVLAIIAGAVLAGGWFWLQNEVGRDGPLQNPVDFTVERGEGLASVAARLEAAGIVHDRRAVWLKARLDGTQTAVKAGAYTVPARASMGAVLAQLIAGDVVQIRLTIPEGLTTAQILRRIEDASVLEGPMPEQEIAEGVLLPDTYVFGTGTTRTQFINRMQAAQIDLLVRLWAERAPDLPLKTPHEAIILASIVEKEAGRAAEHGKIAGLFIGRMQKGMRLESDPTIIYGVSRGEPLRNRQGQRRTLYRSEIDRKTDWNTYQIDGLPKTAISNPGRAAIAAVLNPLETDYVFFVADGKGGHLFARTYAEHLRNVAAYRAYERGEIARERSN